MDTETPERISKERHIRRSSYVNGCLPHEVGEAYGLDFELWYCRNEGDAYLENFILLRVHFGGKLVPGRRRGRDGLVEDQFHMIDAHDRDNTRKEAWRRLFRLYHKHVREEPDTPLVEVRKIRREVRQEKERLERRKERRKEYRKMRRRKASKYWGRSPELIRPHHIRNTPR